MQQLNGKMRTKDDRESMKNRVRVLFPALAWVTGLLMAGSDGPWMPYINGLGGLIFLGASIWLGRVLPELEKQENEAEVLPRHRALPSSGSRRPGRVQSGYSGQFSLV